MGRARLSREEGAGAEAGAEAGAAAGAARVPASPPGVVEAALPQPQQRPGEARRPGLSCLQLAPQGREAHEAGHVCLLWYPGSRARRTELQCCHLLSSQGGPSARVAAAVTGSGGGPGQPTEVAPRFPTSFAVLKCLLGLRASGASSPRRDVAGGEPRAAGASPPHVHSGGVQQQDNIITTIAQAAQRFQPEGGAGGTLMPCHLALGRYLKCACSSSRTRTHKSHSKQASQPSHPGAGTQK